MGEGVVVWQNHDLDRRGESVRNLPEEEEQIERGVLGGEGGRKGERRARE
jgi:hypothetical protein